MTVSLVLPPSNVRYLTLSRAVAYCRAGRWRFELDLMLCLQHRNSCLDGFRDVDNMVKLIGM